MIHDMHENLSVHTAGCLLMMYSGGCGLVQVDDRSGTVSAWCSRPSVLESPFQFVPPVSFAVEDSVMIYKIVLFESTPVS